MDTEFIQSNEFLASYQWRKLRQEVLIKYDSRCMCCGVKPELDNKVFICVDHIKPRKTHPELALNIANLQVLCNVCNHGKGNWHTKDFREDRTFIVTKYWMETNKTPRGGCTRVH